MIWKHLVLSIGIVIAGLLVVLGALLVVDASRPAFYRKRASRVQVGDGKDRVRSILGRPTGGETTMGPLGVASVAWSYGSYLDYTVRWDRGFPWIEPLQFRMGLNPHNVIVCFDSTGKVVWIQIPKR